MDWTSFRVFKSPAVVLSMVDWNLAGRSVNLLWQISVMVQHRKDFKTDGI